MQSQIAFVPGRPQLVSVAEFDGEPICLFVGIEIIIGAALSEVPQLQINALLLFTSPLEAMLGWTRNALTNQGTAFFG